VSMATLLGNPRRRAAWLTSVVRPEGLTVEPLVYRGASRGGLMSRSRAKSRTAKQTSMPSSGNAMLREPASDAVIAPSTTAWTGGARKTSGRGPCDAEQREAGSVEDVDLALRALDRPGCQERHNASRTGGTEVALAVPTAFGPRSEGLTLAPTRMAQAVRAWRSRGTAATWSSSQFLPM
jgi:hypothetical protein